MVRSCWRMLGGLSWWVAQGRKSGDLPDKGRKVEGRIVVIGKVGLHIDHPLSHGVAHTGVGHDVLKEISKLDMDMKNTNNQEFASNAPFR